MKNNNSILLTIDVEDWFQVENFKQWIPFSSWSSYKLRVEKNTHRLLDLLDFNDRRQRADNGRRITDDGHGKRVRATFFVLGWIAERLPQLVREIHSRGHEVASHGYNHSLCGQESTGELKRDLDNSKKLLEDIIGAKVFGYRAPSFSISDDILSIIEECGYLYDSSFNSFAIHGRYGHLDLSQNGTRGIAIQISRIPPGHRPLWAGGQNLEPRTQNPEPRTHLYELPISNIRFAHLVFPWGGGAYFRLIPFPLLKTGVEFILRHENAYLFYLHPWEIDPNQPRVNDASVFRKIRHYVNLSKTHSKLLKFIRNFQQHRFITCSQYISELEN
jgi:polysaccharide deacetylase family protein (PEP-CTERM system associated)